MKTVKPRAFYIPKRICCTLFCLVMCLYFPLGLLAQEQPTSSEKNGPVLSKEIESALADGLLGDVNGDGQVDSLDAFIILDYDLDESNVPPEFSKDCGDVNGDQVVNTIDALIIYSFYRKVPVDVSLDLETVLCDNNSTTSLDFEIFPKVGGPGSPILITTVDQLSGEVSLSIDDIPAEIISILPTGDSVLAIIPSEVRQDQLVKVQLLDDSLSGTTFHKIESSEYFAQVPVRPPLYILPTGGELTLDEVSFLNSPFINLVNVYDSTHALKLPTGNFTPLPQEICLTEPDPLACQCGVADLIFTESLRDQSTCVEIRWEESRRVCDIAGNTISELILDRRAPNLSDRYKGVFFRQLNELSSGEGVELPSGLEANEVFLLLTSLETDQQYIYRVLPDGSPAERFACYSPPIITESFVEPDSGRAPLTISFGAEAIDPDGGPDNGVISSFTWRFGNGDSTTSQDEPYVYEVPGTYSLTLIAEDNEGDAAVQVFEVFVDSPLVEPIITLFEVEPDSGDLPLQVTLNTDAFDRDGGEIVSYSWDPGDATAPILGQDTTHTYDTAGTFIMTLTVTDDDGQERMLSDTIQVVTPPIVSCEAVSDPLRLSREVTFTAFGTDPDGGSERLVYNWEFGDDSTGTGASTTHIYQQSGTYEVQLVVTDDEGQTDTCITSIFVPEPFQAPVVSCSFTFEGDIPRVGTPLTFIGEAVDIDGGVIQSYEWDFGDGNAGNGDTVVHTYQSENSYSVVLTVTDDEGETNTCTDITIGIEVPLTPPVISLCSLAVENESGRAPLPVSFYAEARDLDGGQVTYLWDFGDGTDPATEQNPTHIYQSEGSYEVTLTVTDDEGAVTLCDTLEVFVKVPFADPRIEVCEAEIRGETGRAPLLVNFRAEAIDPDNDPDDPEPTYFWDFGDGVTASGAVVEHTYLQADTVTVVLTATDNEGVAVVCDTLSIQVGKPFSVPEVEDCVAEPRTGIAGETVITFTAVNARDEDGGEIQNFAWDFGDGERGQGESTTYVYPEENTYTVVLTILDDEGVTATCETELIIDPAPIAPEISCAIEIPTASFEGTADLNVLITATASDVDSETDPIVTWQILNEETDEVVREGDGQTISEVLDVAGRYVAVFTATDADGLTDVCTTDVITVNPDQLPQLSTLGADKTEGEAPLTVSFNPVAFDPEPDGGEITSFLWEFPGGSPANAVGQTPSTTFENAGNYTVTLTVMDDEGSMTTGTETIQVLPKKEPPRFVEDCKVEPLRGSVPHTISFSALAEDPDGGEELSYLWRFGEGLPTRSEASGTYDFVEEGTYEVSLTVTDDEGQTNSCSQQVEVLLLVTGVYPEFNAVNKELRIEVNPEQPVDQDSKVFFINPNEPGSEGLEAEVLGLNTSKNWIIVRIPTNLPVGMVTVEVQTGDLSAAFQYELVNFSGSGLPPGSTGGIVVPPPPVPVASAGASSDAASFYAFANINDPGHYLYIPLTDFEPKPVALCETPEAREEIREDSIFCMCEIGEFAGVAASESYGERGNKTVSCLSVKWTDGLGPCESDTASIESLTIFRGPDAVDNVYSGQLFPADAIEVDIPQELLDEIDYTFPSFLGEPLSEEPILLLLTSEAGIQYLFVATGPGEGECRD